MSWSQDAAVEVQRLTDELTAVAARLAGAHPQSWVSPAAAACQRELAHQLSWLCRIGADLDDVRLAVLTHTNTADDRTRVIGHG